MKSNYKEVSFLVKIRVYKGFTPKNIPITIIEALKLFKIKYIRVEWVGTGEAMVYDEEN